MKSTPPLGGVLFLCPRSVVHGGDALDFMLQVFPDVERFKTFALFSEAEKKVIMIFVVDEGEIYNIICVAIRYAAVIEKAGALLSAGGTVCAICGATAALANAGLLDQRLHTGNGRGYLEMMAPGYKGQSFYVEEPCVADRNLITAGSTGALPWAKRIIGSLNVFRPDTLEAWYQYFSSGEERHFFALMQTLPAIL